MKKENLPELLSPAGSFSAFEAAIDGGADAIYVGGTSFNARINAENFSDSELAQAIKKAHIHGVKVYRALNIELYDREIPEFLDSAYRSASDGIDAFIVSDTGGARLLHEAIPDLPLHASTQMSIHSSDGAKMLEDMGFTRVVPARELSAEDIESIVKGTSLEIEIFVHGALCVSHSGQCLFSSLVGGRSGNRGLCAQPCRLPYSCASCKNGRAEYPLSLKDLSLAPHVKRIIDSGVASLKIEGRMKSAEYVYGVTKIWRELLDAGKNADESEMKKLSEIFSRGGFTDGYYTGKIGHGMLGVRSEEDKKVSREQDAYRSREKRRVPLDMELTIEPGKPSQLILHCGSVSVSVKGSAPFEAQNAPSSEQNLKKSLSKLGQTEFVSGKIDCNIVARPMMPVSALNDLRRRGAEAMEYELSKTEPYAIGEAVLLSPVGKRKNKSSARFLSAEQITDMAKEYFDSTFLPLWKYDIRADGFIMPSVITDSEREEAKRLIEKAVASGARTAVVGNLGGYRMLEGYGLEIIGDYRFNVTNTQSVCTLEKMGIGEIILSPELKLPQARDIEGNVSLITYGRIPLMTLEKCVIRELADCERCKQGAVFMKDRRGYTFPVIREWGHRNIVYNSQVTYMGDRERELCAANTSNRHFIFTVEGPKEVDRVIDMHKKHLTPDFVTRRI